jgi:hypothetical protein
MRLCRLLTVTMAAVLLLAGSAGAAEWRVPGHFHTIQAAIDSARVVDGDTILVKHHVCRGATVTKAVVIRGHGRVTIWDGPAVNDAGKAGFLFPGHGKGSGATVTGFTFHRVAFPVFSRGANDVSVTHNSMSFSIQAVTNWAVGKFGDGWNISHNEISYLRTSCGGGIGILIGDYAGGTVTGNEIAHNRIDSRLHVPQTDCGGYDAPGIVLFADFRYPGDEGAVIKWNRVFKNRVVVSSGKPSLVPATAIELTDTRDDWTIQPPVIQKNDVVYNDLRGTAVPFEFTPDGLEDENRIEHNYTGPGGHWPDRALTSAVSVAPEAPATSGAAPLR